MRVLVVVLVCACSRPAPRVVIHAPPPRAIAPAVAPIEAKLEPKLVPLPEPAPFRMPRTFAPARYRVRLAFAPTDAWITGHAEIDGTLDAPAPFVWLHAEALAITHAVAISGDTQVELGVSVEDADQQMIALVPPAPLAAGAWTLALDYFAPIDDVLPRTLKVRPARGAFRRTVDGRAYIATQGEAIATRRWLPCIDEPDRKVPLQLTLDVPADVVAASNAPIARTTPLGKRAHVVFAETAPLSTYLYAFTVGPYEVVDAGETAAHVPMRVLALHGHAAAVAKIAHEVPAILDSLATYFDVPYAFGKLDVVEVANLGFGAMENAGLVTIESRELESAAGAGILTHEFVHQWFGNLVTPAWWDQLWLSESFAYYLRSQHPDRRDEAESWAARALPLEPVILHTTDLDGIFEHHAVTARGRAILALYEAHVGAARFRAGLHAYLVAHAGGVATSGDLVAAMGNDPELRALVDTTLPTVTPRVACKRVALDGLGVPANVCAAYDRDGARAVQCERVERELVLVANRCPTWVLVDPEAIGMFSVSYGSTLHDVVAHGWGALTSAERLRLLERATDPDDKLRAIGAFGAFTIPAEDLQWLPGLDAQVPDDLRPALTAWIAKHYPVAGLHLGQSDPNLVALGFVAREPGLVAEAVARARKPAKFHGQIELGYAVNDRGTAEALFASFAAPDKTAWSRTAILDALAHRADIASVVAATPAHLDHLEAAEQLALFRRICDPAERQVLATLAAANQSAVKTALANIDRCLVERKRREPLFRAWLGATP